MGDDGIVRSRVAPGAAAQGGRADAAPRPGGRRRAALAALARQHWLAAVLLAAGLALRVLTAFTYRPILFYIDSTRYLNNAYGMDPAGYKGPLTVILFAAGFAAVAAVQHLLGLAMAVVIYLLLLRRGTSRWLAALAMAPVLLDAYQLQIEQSVMPESWFEALAVAGIAVLLWRPRPGWRAMAAAGLLLGTTATFAQVGEVLLLPAVVYAVAVGGGWRLAAGRVAVLAAAFAVPVAAYCAGSLLLTGNFLLSQTGVTSMYGRLAAAADCATLTLPGGERAMCPDKAEQAEGPDWLEYDRGSPIRPYYSRLPRAETDSMISDFNQRVLTQQPGRVLAAYGRDVVKLFALTRDGDPGDTAISRWQFQDSYPYYPEPGPSPGSGASRAYVLRTTAGAGGPPAVWRPGAEFLRGYQLGGGYTPGPLFALLTLTGLAGAAAGFRRRLAPETRQRALACLLFLGCGVVLLAASDALEFSWRYQLPALVTLVPAGCGGIGVIARARRTRSAPPPPPSAPAQP